MLDAGLLATGLAMWLVVAAAARWAPVEGLDRGDVVGSLALPVVAGILAGRAATAVLDDPASLRSLRAFLVIRGGAELWPGVVVTAGLVLFGACRRGDPAVRLLADLAPFMLWGYATYEAGCLLRDGCYGPASPIGLTPAGLRTSMFPVGLVVAAAVAGLGVGLRHMSNRPPVVRVLVGAAGLAGARSVASIWLPRLSDGLTRQHIESLVALAASGAGLLAVWLPQHRRTGGLAVATATDTRTSRDERGP